MIACAETVGKLSNQPSESISLFDYTGQHTDRFVGIIMCHVFRCFTAVHTKSIVVSRFVPFWIYFVFGFMCVCFLGTEPGSVCALRMATATSNKCL